ncbi:GOLPH3/VPS74 family protein [Actinokineospora pegani]|uniref:GOLPH3/VPS74 family protein n=1 Tax=Actinokineospora pegani TaxID=2654637 RepID=UPI0018D46132|nr:GPP34 family phosphoprotein [Actinokineospora pegani]
MLIAEDLLLLLLDDESGRVKPAGTQVDTGLAGAVLVELAGLGLVDVAGEGAPAKKGRVVRRPGSPPEHQVLRGCYARIAEWEGREPGPVLAKLAKGLRAEITASLVVRGLVREESRKVLGLIPTTRVFPRDADHEAQVRARLDAVLAGAEPDHHSGALITLLHALDVLPRVLDVRDKKAAKRRAKELADGDWASEAVRKAVAQVNQAVLVAVASSSSGGGDGGGGG